MCKPSYKQTTINRTRTFTKATLRAAYLIILLSVSLPVSGGTWKIGGKVSMQQGDGQPALVTAVTAEYQIISMLSWRTDLEMVFREMGKDPEFDISVPTNLLWYPLAHKKVIEPYIGPGLVYTCALPNTHSFGTNVLGGINFNLPKKPTFGLEVKYTVTDIIRWGASDNISVSLTGAWKVNF
jgi:hypothetical protein